MQKSFCTPTRKVENQCCKKCRTNITSTTQTKTLKLVSDDDEQNHAISFASLKLFNKIKETAYFNQ